MFSRSLYFCLVQIYRSYLQIMSTILQYCGYRESPTKKQKYETKKKQDLKQNKTYETQKTQTNFFYQAICINLAFESAVVRVFYIYI